MDVVPRGRTSPPQSTVLHFGHGSNPRAPSANLFSEITLCTECLTPLRLLLIQHGLNDSLPVERLQLISSLGDSGSVSRPFIPEPNTIMSSSPINGALLCGCRV